MMWKKIDQYPNYSVSYDGQIRNDIKGNIKNIRVKDGYCFVGLSKQGKKKWVSVHRLVALAFIDQVDGLNEVNHIDGNKLNNNVYNLEWSNRLLNNRHSIKTGLRQPENNRIRPVYQYDKSGNFIREWRSGRFASRSLQMDETTISKVALGQRLTAGGFRWAFKDRTLPVLLR